MIGPILAIIAMFFSEIGISVGKAGVRDHRESIYTMGFLNLLWGTLVLFAIAFLRQEFIFSYESLPTFGIRMLLEIAQAHVGILAIVKADRSTAGFLMIITIPLLLIIDTALGYTVEPIQSAGIAIIVIALVFLLMNHGIRMKGIWYVLFAAVNAAATISLYKYNITNFNSVEAEQGFSMIILMIYFLAMALFVARENPLQLLKQPRFLAQSFSMGVGTVFVSFAYLFAPASIITTAKRSAAILWATMSGNLYFHEKKLVVKVVSFIFIAVGLVFLVL